MLKKTLLALACAATLPAAILPASAIAADAYPSKPIRFIVPYPPGGPTDLMARLLQVSMQKQLGVSVVVENKAGAGGNIGSDQVAKSEPDGHTLLLAASGPMAVNPTLYKALPFNPVKDFAPVVQISAFPMVLEVNPNVVKATDLKSFIAAAKAKPELFSFASAGSGTPQHLAGEMFNRAAGTTMQHVPYKGAGPALNDLVGGQVPVMLDIVGSSLQYIKAGRLRPIAVTTAQRSAALPDVPTLAESGLPGFDMSGWHGIAVAAGTPRPIVDRLNQVVNTAFADPELRARWEALGTPAVGGTPEQFEKLIKSENVRLGAVVKASGATAD
ncbi:Bug family tripartite tricarboxylate transporter substrate binding protein [Pigmentiphaga litoralis]|uniref:Tripartite-type tricarboxylate transporter receptor subunit TctC n=1 Tax=Pigmentiphaga litoralis TaxID=516702 RepID=A0A7Y9LMU8_9BURK|nr:tripartite tricarboxylate transporter substrate binding protein [Pigmentiphaga litoralis]NYE24335.1 tripartite-type tricarboxylate transporter receptor subunit TctC [Pigmentiphaga litoralis]NYE82051.1 tripartite-type tricarboxylate transporter receptor subunit TctC [Pigmentiphaga litoralis]